MALTTEEKDALLAAVNEIGAAVEARFAATTTAARTAAATRFRTGFRDYTMAILNMIKYGSQGDYV
jgi:hypothetical protein